MTREGKGRAHSSEAGIRFLAVARIVDRVVVASYTHVDSSRRGDSSSSQVYADVLQRVLKSQQTVEQNPRLTITDRDVGTVHYDTDGSTAIYLAVTAFEYPQRTAFKCLADLKSRFQASFGEALHKSAEGGLTKVARQILVDICNTFADPAAVDKTVGVLKQVEEVKGIMHDSINEMLATRDNLEVLEDKTEAMNSQAATFQRQATSLKRHMWWRNMKLKLVCAMIIIIVLCYIFVPQMLSSMPADDGESGESGESGTAQARAPAASAHPRLSKPASLRHASTPPPEPHEYTRSLARAPPGKHRGGRDDSRRRGRLRRAQQVTRSACASCFATSLQSVCPVVKDKSRNAITFDLLGLAVSDTRG